MSNHIPKQAIIIIALLSINTGCSYLGLSELPKPETLSFVHKIDVQQGNVITQDMLAKLKPGMDKKKVQFIMGTPIIKDTFNDHRWDYIFTFNHARKFYKKRVITLNFENDVLKNIEGDIKPAKKPLEYNIHNDTKIAVPRFRKRTLGERIANKIPFMGEKEKTKFLDVEEPGAGVEPKKDIEYHEDVIVKAEEKDPYRDIQAGPGLGLATNPEQKNANSDSQKKSTLFSRIFD
jgi:outer membrane protein assembly factor BamE